MVLRNLDTVYILYLKGFLRFYSVKFSSGFQILLGCTQLICGLPDATHSPPALDDLDGNGFSGLKRALSKLF